jgi:UDPglucose 6-dehydrogenase
MIGFAGLSHLGIVSSLAAASRGGPVIAYHPSAGLCGDLAAGRLPIHEPGLAELHASYRGQMRYTAEPAALADCDLVYVSLDVPTDATGKSDLEPLEALTDKIVPHLRPGTVLVFLSQLPPGYMRRWDKATAARNLIVYHQVETLIFGRAVERALKPERFIVGCADPSRELPAPYRTFLESFTCPILRMRYESAELAKIAINLFLASTVTTTNVVAELCEAIGAEWAEIAPALRLDRRIGTYAYLTPGLGLAGGNLERDLATVRRLTAEFGTESGVVAAWLEDSAYRRDWVLRVLHERRRGDDPIIALWGLAYKQDTASTRNSPALHLLEVLDTGRVRTYDPQVRLPASDFPGLMQTSTALDACRGADVLVVMTPWSEFAAVDLGAVRGVMAGREIVDPFGILDGARCRQLGFIYHRLGSPALSAEVPA